METKILIDETLCDGCNKCVEVCEHAVLYIDDFSGLCKVRNLDKCDRKGACINVCPHSAIKIIAVSNT